MLDITILAVGKIKEKYWSAAADEYIKRLKPYVRLRWEELSPAPFAHGDKDKAKDLEGERILHYLRKAEAKDTAQVYLLAERGGTFSSPDFASWLLKQSPLILVVGGALGFSRELYEKYPQISLSSLTFPHELVRVVLLEQLYRAATIINKKDYHY
jgi:23S rRNA (pseudouridine1915-N3)-methyltransferase